MTTYKRNDKIRENRQGSRVLTVMTQIENVIETYEGITIHVTKAVAA